MSYHSVSTDKAENGFVVSVTHEDKDHHEHKKFVAKTRKEAEHLSRKGIAGKLTKKRDGGKK